MGMVIFPFVANPLLKGITNINDAQFEQLMNERKALIANWVMKIMT